MTIGEERGGITLRSLAILLQGASSWGPVLSYSQWVRGQKTGSGLETGKGIVIFIGVVPLSLMIIQL